MKFCQQTSEYLGQCGVKTEEKIRKAPLQSVLVAGGVGYLLRFLPIVTIVAVLSRLALVLLRPALIIFGIFKISQCLRAQCQACAKETTLSEAEFPRPVTPQ